MLLEAVQYVCFGVLTEAQRDLIDTSQQVAKPVNCGDHIQSSAWIRMERALPCTEVTRKTRTNRGRLPRYLG